MRDLVIDIALLEAYFSNYYLFIIIGYYSDILGYVYRIDKKLYKEAKTLQSPHWKY